MYFVPITQTDDITLEQLRIARNDDSVRLMMQNQEIISKEEHSAWVKSVQSDVKRLDYVLIDDDHTFMGITSIKSIDFKLRKAEWAYFLSSQFRNRGIGNHLARYTLKITFHSLKLEKLFAKVKDTNLVSQNFLLRYGFKRTPLFYPELKETNNLLSFYSTRHFLPQNIFKNSEYFPIQK